MSEPVQTPLRQCTLSKTWREKQESLL